MFSDHTYRKNRRITLEIIILMGLLCLLVIDCIGESRATVLGTESWIMTFSNCPRCQILICI